MKTIREIRFITANYFTLQGLRAVPLGLCLVLVCLWANNLQYPLDWSDYVMPGLCVLGMLVLLTGLEQYYNRSFGRVKQTNECRRLEWLTSIIFGTLALAAFWLDVKYKLPVSLLGLVFAAGLMADFIRLNWLVKGFYLPYYPIGAILMAGASILPSLGVKDWWQAAGIKNQMIGIAMLIGLFSIFAGIWGHVFLVKTLTTKAENQ